MSKITVSFKNTKKDKELFEVLNNLEEKSVEIKDILYKHFFEKTETKEEVKKENLKVDISDF